jgi:UTP--glucose-1-phosphate uridylyltransferase
MVRKAIIPIAGLGTRMLPLTKVVPKALLPVWNKPVIHWIVEELVESGIEEIVIVYSKGQEMVKDYFGSIEWLEEKLKKRGKDEKLQELFDLQGLAKFCFVEQKDQLGDGHAVLQVKDLMGDEPFVVVFGDCLWNSRQSSVVSRQLIDFSRDKGGCCVGLSKVGKGDVDKYGIVELDNQSRVKNMVEKPEVGFLDSNLAIVGRYVLTSSIWEHLEKGMAESGEERLIDALESLRKDSPMYGLELDGTWLDVGSVEGLWKAGELFRA